MALIPAEAMARCFRGDGRSCAHFAPEHERECSGDQAGDDARPRWNEDAIHCDVPSQSDAKQLKERDERENDDGDSGKGFHRNLR